MGSSGRRAGNQLGNPESDLNAANREQTALEMRLRGKEFAEIAEACGYVSNGKPNRSAAFKAYRRALHRMPGAQAKVEELRAEMRLRYNLARDGMWDLFTAGKRSAIEAMVLMDRHEAELFGAYPDKDERLSSVTFTKRIIIEEETRPNEPPAVHEIGEASEASE